MFRPGAGVVVGGGEGGGVLGQAGEVPDQGGLDECFLGREVAEHGRDADAGQPRHVLGGAGFALRAEDLVGGDQDAFAVLSGVLAHAATLTEVQTSVR